jgi:hypothetical protein
MHSFMLSSYALVCLEVAKFQQVFPSDPCMHIVTYTWLAWRIFVRSELDESIIDISQVVTTSNYNTIADLHSTNHSILLFLVYFH